MHMDSLIEPPRLVKKSSSFNAINSSSFNEQTNNKLNTKSEDEEWCQVTPSTPDNSNQLLLGTLQGYNAENVLLYLIDMQIMSAEQIKWQKFVENVDFLGDPGPIRDLVPDFDDQPSTSTQSFNHTDQENETETPNKNLNESPNEEQDASELIVITLMEYFKNNQNGSNANLTRIPYLDAPENLLRMYNRLPDPPNEFYIVDGQRIRLRNSMKWRPPKKTFIFELPKFQHHESTLLKRQNFSCAGCNLKLYKRNPHYCHYFNQLFCKLCFQGQTARIPARILHKWDFTEHVVSDLAYKFLSENEDQPVFDIHVIEQSLFRKVKNLRLMRSIRLKISHLWEYIKRCPNSSGIATKYGILRTMFEAVPSRFLSIELSYMYSILDFVSIENGNLVRMLKPLETFGSSHVLKCEICEQRGFLCQICMKPDQIIFPFQLEKVFRCEACGSLQHLTCYHRKMSQDKVYACSRCERIRKKKLMQQRPFESSNSD